MEKLNKVVILKNSEVLVGRRRDRTNKATTVGYFSSESSDTPSSSTSSNHRFIVVGYRVNGDPGYVCECGVAFVSKELSVEHYNANKTQDSEDDSTEEDAFTSSPSIAQSEINHAPVSVTIAQSEMKRATVSVKAAQSKSKRARVSVKKANDLNKKIKKKSLVTLGKRAMKKTNGLILEGICARYGVPQTVSSRHLLAEKLGMSTVTFERKLISIREGNMANQIIDPVIQKKADELHLKISQTLEKDPYVDMRTSVDVAFCNEKILMVHAIFRFSGLRITKQFLMKCAYELKLSCNSVYKTWMLAIEISLTKGDYVYDKYFTEKIVKNAQELYHNIMRFTTSKSIADNDVNNLEVLNPTISDTRSRFIIEALFMTYGANIHWSYLETYAMKLDIHRKKMFKAWKDALIRIMFSKDNPYLKFITEDVKDEAEKIHESIADYLKTAEGGPRTTNSIEVLRITDNHAEYVKSEGARWKAIMEEVYRCFGYQHNFHHLIAYAKFLNISESYVYRHWYEIKNNGVLEVNADAYYQQKLKEEAINIKKRVDDEVATILGYQSMSQDEKKETMVKAELMMTEIFSKHGVIKNKFYLESCAALMCVGFEDFYACVERVQFFLKQDSGEKLRMEIPSIREEAYELHNNVMMCMQNSWMINDGSYIQ